MDKTIIVIAGIVIGVYVVYYAVTFIRKKKD
jgi:hypothetical protein